MMVRSNSSKDWASSLDTTEPSGRHLGNTEFLNLPLEIFWSSEWSWAICTSIECADFHLINTKNKCRGRSTTSQKTEVKAEIDLCDTQADLGLSQDWACHHMRPTNLPQVLCAHGPPQPGRIVHVWLWDVHLFAKEDCVPSLWQRLEFKLP